MEFDHTLNLFKIRASKALRRSDPERHQAVFGDEKEDLGGVTLERIFEAGPILDHERTHPVHSLIRNVSDSGDDLQEWVKVGGSPLISTRHDGEPAYGWLPIFGYFECFMDGDRARGFINTDQIKSLSLEQWRRGTDDEMVASSLLRGLSKGLIECYHLGTSIPEALFDAFKTPAVESSAVELLRGATFPLGEKSLYASAECALMTAAVFNRLGLTELRQAVVESPVFTEHVQPTFFMAGHLLMASLRESKNSSIAHALQFLHEHLGIKPTDSVIDHALKQPFDLFYNAPNREFVYERATRRLEYLIEEGGLSQAKHWLKDALPYMDRFPVIPEDQKAEFLAACSIGENGSVMEDLRVKNSQALPFLIRTMGAESFVGAFGEFCERVVSLAANPVAGQSLYSTDLIGLDVQALKEQCVLHDTLDCIMGVYPQLWAKDASELLGGKQNFFIEQKFKRLTAWIGEALTSEPCNERAVAWFKLLEHPFAQEMYVASMPPNQAVFRLMSFKQRATQFGQDLGL